MNHGLVEIGMFPDAFLADDGCGNRSYRVLTGINVPKTTLASAESAHLLSPLL